MSSIYYAFSKFSSHSNHLHATLQANTDHEQKVKVRHWEELCGRMSDFKLKCPQNKLIPSKNFLIGYNSTEHVPMPDAT